MIDGIPVSFTDLSAGGIVVMIVVMILTRRLVPLGALRDEQKTTEFWRTVATSKDTTIATQASTIATQADTIKELSEVGETAAKIMTVLQERARDGSGA